MCSSPRPIKSLESKFPAIVVSIVALLALSVTCGQAAMITVPNYSFESPALTDGGTADSGITYAANPCVILHPDSTMFTGAGGTGTPLGGEGSQVGEIIGNSWGAWYILLGHTIAAGETYTFTVASGYRKDLSSYDNNDIVLSAESQGLSFANLLARSSFAAADLPCGELTDFSVQYTVPTGSPFIGQKLAIWGTSGSNTDGQYATAFDNIRVDVTSIPEPGTIALLAIGLFCATAWRKRK
ncbi:MAG: PEP-CTERM sorting domain-containing protein [Lentisphaeria bacterium]